MMKDLKDLYKRIDSRIEKYGELSEDEIQREIEEYRAEKKVQYPTFRAVLDYLDESNKIMYDKDGAIVWIFADNTKLKKLLKTSRSLL
jgi:hypothetical protein